MAGFYSARSEALPPLPWPIFATPFSHGKGINISSASAGPPLSKAFAYSVAKAEIKNLTQNLGREWGTTGVRVNAIRPGFFPTELNRKNFITPERKAAILGRTAMKRYGEPEELTGALIWLARVRRAS